MSSPSPLSDPGAPSLAAIFLGASKFEHFPRLDNPAFLASQIAFRSAFTDPRASIFGDRVAVLDLFDSSKNPIEVIKEITRFLKDNDSSDVLLYYCGHGDFFDGDTYFLLLRNTEEGYEYITGLQSSALKNAFQLYRGNKRLFIVIDSCFAGEVPRTWMSRDVQPRISRQWASDFPKQGTVLAVASAKDKVALAPEGDALTMFTGALVDTMRVGIIEAPKYFSFRDLFTRARDQIRARGDGVMPELHQTEQEGGDVTQLPIFANAAYGRFTDPALKDQIDRALESLKNDLYPDMRLVGLRALNMPLDRVAFALRQTVANQLGEIAKSDDSARVRTLAEQVGEHWLKSLSLQPDSPAPKFSAAPVSPRTDVAPISEVGQPAFFAGAAVPTTIEPAADCAPDEGSTDAPAGSLATGPHQDGAQAQSLHAGKSDRAGFFRFIWPEGRTKRLVRVSLALFVVAFGPVLLVLSLSPSRPPAERPAKHNSDSARSPTWVPTFER